MGVNPQFCYDDEEIKRVFMTARIIFKGGLSFRDGELDGAKSREKVQRTNDVCAEINLRLRATYAKSYSK